MLMTEIHSKEVVMGSELALVRWLAIMMERSAV
jgi:hypothetical protein